MRVREVADRLGLTSQGVIHSLLHKRIPGGEVAYVDGRGRSHWRVDREILERHLAALAAERAKAFPDVALVYFVQQVGAVDAPVKIGTTRTRLLRQRLGAIQNGSPVKLEIVAAMLGDRQREQQLHREFAEHRLHGEWFAMNPALRALLIEEASASLVAKLCA
jgi:hypothetical protein